MSPTPNPLGFCMLCSEMGTLRSAVIDSRLRNRADRAYLCEYHYRTHGNGNGTPLRGGK